MKHRFLLAAAATIIGAVSSVSAQQPTSRNAVTLKEAQPGLVSLATVSVDSARRTALASARGKIVSERLEKRADQVVYVFEIRSGKLTRHVMVDARSGSLVPMQAHNGTNHHKQVASGKTEAQRS